MKRIIIFAITVALLSAASLHARRKGPDKVASITKDGIEYRVQHFPNMGYVEAWKGKRSIWRRQIYVVKLQLVERDVQDVFIKKMNLEGNFLIITNERGSVYQLNLETLEVKVIKGSLVEEKFTK